MSIKTKVEKYFGKRGAEKLSLLKTQAQFTINRTIRTIIASKTKPQSSPHYKIDRYTGSHAHTFFGYYDVTPFSGDNTKLLAMVTSSADHGISAMADVTIGYFKLQDLNDFVPVGTSSTWCWQMGCRLQWHPADANRLILYNTMVNGSYGSVVLDVGNLKIQKQYDRPIYAIDSSGNRGLSVNFSRLHRLRPGYGYRNLPDAFNGNRCPENDGIWRIDMTTGKSDLMIDLFRLSCFDPSPSMKNAEHYVNHLAFNPSGKRFMFFHLWDINGQRFNRLITCDWNGQNLCVLESEGTASHYTWKTETELLASVHYGKAGTRYNLYTDGNGHKAVIGQNLLTQDGHPSYSPQGNLLLTDTYPDKYREQHVLLLTADGRLIERAHLYSPPAFRGETRCDLHPRWDRTGRLICVDDTADGLRKLAVIALGDDLSG